MAASAMGEGRIQRLQQLMEGEEFRTSTMPRRMGTGHAETKQATLEQGWGGHPGPSTKQSSSEQCGTSSGHPCSLQQLLPGSTCSRADPTTLAQT